MAVPIADHGALLTTVPFVAPAILIVGSLLAVAVRDRLRGRRDDGSSDPGK